MRNKYSNVLPHFDLDVARVVHFESCSCKIHLIEVKAGTTITRDYFKGLNHFVKIFSEQIPEGMGFIYGGDESQQRTDVFIVPFNRMNDLFLWNLQHLIR